MTTMSDHVGEIQVWVEDIMVYVPCNYEGKVREQEFWRRLAESLATHAETEPLTPAQAELYLKCRAKEE